MYLSKGEIFLDYYRRYDSPMGPLLLISDGKNLTGLYMNRPIPEKMTQLPVFQKTEGWLDAYFQGQVRPLDFPIRADGTEFQMRVWDILLTIPFGQTRTYGHIAREMAQILGKEKMSAQAVGQAVGRNPISILIPCHRCLGAKGQLTGYAGGIENKLWLLRHEGWQTAENRV